MKRLLLALFILCVAAPAVAGVIVPDRIDYRFNVKRYGAVGDGVTNDRAAIQLALNAGAGDVVFFPEGIYLIDTVLRCSTKTTMLGSGRATEIRLTSAAESHMVLNADTSSSSNDSGIVIDGLYFNGQQTWANWGAASAAAAEDAVVLKRVKGGAVRNCFFGSVKRDAIALRSSKDCQVTNNYIWDSGEEGISTSGGSVGGHLISGNTIVGQDSTFESAGDKGGGILVKTPNTTISNNTITYCGTQIDINWEGQDSLYNIIVADNNLHLGMGNGIAMLGAHHSQITGNTIYDHFGFGIVCGRKINASDTAIANNITIANNVIRNVRDHTGSTAADYGIELQWGSHYTVQGNVIDSVGEFGIDCRANYSIISGNHIRKTGNDGIQLTDSMIGCVVSGNFIDSAGLDNTAGKGHGIHLLSSTATIEKMLVSGNRASNCYLSGIYADSVHNSAFNSNVLISNNRAGNNSSGLVLSKCNKNTVTGNATFGNAYGIRLVDGGRGNTVSSNVTLNATLGTFPNDTFGIVVDTGNLVAGNSEDTAGVNKWYANLPAWKGVQTHTDSQLATKGYVDRIITGGDTTAKALYNPGTVNDTMRFLTDAGNTRDTLHIGSDEVAVIVRSTDSLYVEANRVGIPGGPLVEVVSDTLRPNDSGLAFLGKNAFPWAEAYVNKLWLHETTGTDSRIPISQVGPSTGNVLTYNGTDWGPAPGDTTTMASKNAAKKYTWGALAWRYVDTSTTDADPGPNVMRFNNATTNAATFAYVDDITMAGYQVDSILQTAQARDVLFCKKQGTLSEQLFKITGSAVDGTGYWKLPIAFIDGVTDFTHQDTLLFEIHTYDDAGGGGNADSMRAIRLVHPASNDDTTYWKSDGGTNTNDTLHVGSNETAVVIASNDTLKVAADQIGKGAALLNLTAAGLIPVTADSMDLGSAAIKYDTVFANVIVGAAAGSGTGDTLIVNIGGTEYSIVSNRIKAKAGSGITFIRHDSTSFDVWLLQVDSTAGKVYYARKADTASYLTTVPGDTEYASLVPGSNAFLPSKSYLDVGTSAARWRDGNFSRKLVAPYLDAETLAVGSASFPLVFISDSLRPAANNTQELGMPTFRWERVYSQAYHGDSINLGEGNIGNLTGDALIITSGNLNVSPGANMEISGDAIRPSINIAGDGLTGGGANDVDVAPGTGISVAGDVVSATLGTSITQGEIEGLAYAWPLNWVYSTATGLADPGTGAMRFNAAPTSATEAYVDSVTAAGLGRIPDSLLRYVQKGDMISFMEPTNPGSRLFYNITDLATDTSGFWKLFISYVVGTGTGIANNDTLIAQIHWTRDSVGSGGGGSGTFADSSLYLIDAHAMDKKANWSGQTLRLEDITASAQVVQITAPNDLLYIGDTADAGATVFYPDTVRPETTNEALLGTSGLRWANTQTRSIDTDSLRVVTTVATGDINATAGTNQTLSVDSILIGSDQIGDFATGAVSSGLEVSSGQLRIDADVAGDALTGGGGADLDVVAGTNLEISSDALRIAASAAGDGLVGGAAADLDVVGDSTITAAANNLTVAKIPDSAVSGSGKIVANAVQDADIDWPSHRRLPDRWATKALETADSLVFTQTVYRMTGDSGTIEIWDVVDSSYDVTAENTADTLLALWQLQPGEDQIDSFILLMDNELTANDSSCIKKIQFFRWAANAFDVTTADLEVTTGWVSGAAAQDFSTNITNITTADPGEFYAVRLIVAVTSGATKGRLGFNFMLVFDD